MNLGLKGMNALITGGSHGIGRSTAIALAREGCNVAICARGKKNLSESVNELKKWGIDAIGIQADVLRAADINRVIRTVLKKWKTISILVNNVGGGGRWGKPVIEETDEKVWIDVYNKNALAAKRFSMKVLPCMRKQKWGRIVTISSICGCQGGARPWFSMAKSAEIVLMKSLAMVPYLVRDGITFNSVAPGSIMIPDTGWELEKKKNPQAFSKQLKAIFPLGRLGTPEEVADVVVFLCSRNASLVNGACVIVDGAESKCY